MTSLTSAATPATAPPFSWRKALSADLRAFWPLWLIVALAVFLRLYEVHRLPGMQGDEAWYGLQARLWLDGQQIEWRTPTGNVPGMIHMWSLVLLHALFEPSLLLLRLPSITSSVAALLLAYAVGRRFFGQAAAMVALVLMACFPINIAYARLGWDPSHSPLLVLAAAYAAFAGRRLLCGLLFALALTNHPSAVFTAPFLTLGFLGFAAQRDGTRLAVWQTVQVAALLLIAILLAMALSPSTTHYLSLSRSMTRLFDPGAWLGFGQMFGRLLSGDTVYAYIFGSGFAAARLWADGAVTAGLITAVAAGGVALWRRWDWPTAGILAGWLASLSLLYLIAGLWVMSPTLERFAVPMIPLTALAIAAIAARLWPDGGRWLYLMIAAIGLPLLAGYWIHYVRPLQNGEVRPVRGFWTAEQDPNLVAYRRIAEDAGQAGAQIIAEDWWLQLPISYYAVGERFQVTGVSTDRSQPREPAAATYWVLYGGGQLDRALARRSEGRPTWTIPTTSPRNTIHVWRDPQGIAIRRPAGR